MFGLTGITLHHSAFRGKTVHFQADGNTNISGGNGVGKTTTMNLIPVFYGECPERMVSKAAGKSSFLDHYLPTWASVIAFHYTRSDGQNMAVMYRHRTGSVAYRFVKGDWIDTFFHPQLKAKMAKGIPVTEAFDEMKTRGVTLSEQLKSTIDYRSVIQNDRKLFRRGAKSQSKYQRLGREYGIGSSHTTMSHMQELTYALMSRNNMFARLKSMICGTMFEGIHIPERPEHAKDANLIENIDSLREFFQNEDNMKACINAHHERMDTITQLHATGRGMQKMVSEAKTEIKSLNIAHEDIIREESIWGEEYDQKLNDVNGELVSIESHIKTNNDRRDNIYKARDNWDGEDILQKVSDYENLQTLKDIAKQSNRYWEELCKDIENPQMERSKAEIQAKEELQEATERLGHEITKQKERIQEIEEKAEVEVNAVNRERNQAIEKHQKDNAEQLEFKSRELAKLEMQVENPARTAEEDLELEVAQNAELEAEYACRLTEEKADKSKKIVENCQSKLSDVTNQYNRSRAVLNKAESDRDQIKTKLYPEDNTLLSVLKRSDTDWRDSFGLIINPDLLARKDLSPVFNESTDNVFGWNFDLSVIDRPEFCEGDDYLRALLEKHEQSVRIAKEKLKADEVLLDSTQKDVMRAERQITIERSALSRARNDLESARQSKFAVNERVRSAIDARKIETKDLLKKTGKEFEAWKAAQEDIREAINGLYSERVLEIKGRLATEISGIDGVITTKVELKNKLKCDCEERLKEIKEQFDEACAEKGINPNMIRKAKEKSDADRARYLVVSNYADLITQYNSWLKVEWSQLSYIDSNLTDLAHKKNEAEELIDKLKTLNATKRYQFKSQKNKISTQLRRIKVEIDDAQYLLDKIGAIPDDDNCHNGTLEILTPRARTLYESSEKLKAQVIKLVETISSIITKHRCSSICDAWERLVEHRVTTGTLHEHDSLFKLQQPMDVEILLNEQLPQIKGSLIELFRAVADRLNKYYESLRKVNRRVSMVSSELGSKINNARNIDAISDIEIILTSSISEDACWQPLIQFSREWEEWNSSQDRAQLPPPSLMEVLSRAMSSLASAKISKNVESLVNLGVRMKENDRPVTIRSDSDLAQSSSNGLSLMAVCIVFVGLSRYLCPDRDVSITWPIDELACLEYKNIVKLFEMFEKENISLFSAFPSTDHNVLKLFKNRLFIDPRSGVKSFKSLDKQGSTENQSKIMNVAKKNKVVVNTERGW